MVRSGAGGTLLYQFNGTVAGGQFGYSVAAADINNDSHAEIIVGARFAGNVYIFNGSDGALLYQQNSTNNFDWLGHSVAVTGKLIAAGAYQGDTRSVSQGGYVQVYQAP